MELLSPAGSYESLIAAVQSGADAVYLGGPKFSARQSAKNFQTEDMKKWTDYCKLYGVRVYVTVNTLIKDEEFSELEEYICHLSEMNIDGILLQDMGAVELIKSISPDIPLHASTQMTATSLEDVLFLQSIGFERVVLSRELSFDEIKYICANTDCEIEVFVHGAICMSYSGQCLMSSILGGRSGNRGRCAQPCRLEYSLEGKGISKKGYLLSPKDMCLINYLNELKEAGVSSLKIEGRLKRAEYVSTVVGIYRDCIDKCRKSTDRDIKLLQSAFGRGFTTGLFGGENGKKMMSHNNPSNIADNIFEADAVARCNENADFRKINVVIRASAKIEKPFEAEMIDSDGNISYAQSQVLCEKAIKSPTGEERIVQSLKKLGGTPYTCNNVELNLEPNVVIPVSEINSVRRNLCRQLNELRTALPNRQIKSYTHKESLKKNHNVEIYCEISDKNQLDAVKSLGIKHVIVPESLQNGKYITKGAFLTKDWNGITDDITMISHFGQINMCTKEMIGSSRLNITNYMSADFYNKYMDKSLLSNELSIKEISLITSRTDLKCGVTAYGRLDLMLCGNCPVKAAGECQNNKIMYTLKDRKGERFPLMCSDNCSMRVLNSKPVFMADKLNDLMRCGIQFIHLIFTDEDYNQTKQIIQMYQRAINGEKIPSLKENTFTRGHFYRGIL